MRRYIKHISQTIGLINLIKQRLDKGQFVAVTLARADEKTLEQLGYLHSAVLPMLTEALFDSGEIKLNSEDAAKLWLKMNIGYGVWYEISGKPVFSAKSFEKANVDDLTKAIDEAIYQAQERGVWIPPPTTNKGDECKN